MPNENAQPIPMYTPRSVLAVERTTNSIVSRFAAPVQAVGSRALGFIDRIIGVRLFGVMAPRATVEVGAPSVGSFVYPRPWYEAPRAPVARRAAPAPTVEAAPAAPAPVAAPVVEEMAVAAALPPAAAAAVALAEARAAAESGEAPVSSRAAAAPSLKQHVINTPPAASAEPVARKTAAPASTSEPAAPSAPAQVTEAVASLATAQAQLAQLAQAQVQAEVRAQQARVEQAQAEARTVEQARVEQAQAEQARTQVQTQQARVEQARVEQARAEQVRVEQARVAVEQARTEQARVEERRAQAQQAARGATAPSAIARPQPPAAITLPSGVKIAVEQVIVRDGAPAEVVLAASPAAADVRARELVGAVREFVAAQPAGLPPALAAIAPVVPAATAAGPVRAATPIARAFAHASWVDQQLARGTQQERAATGGSYVFVASAAAEAATAAARPRRAEVAPLAEPSLPTVAAPAVPAAQAAQVMARAAAAPTANTFVAPPAPTAAEEGEARAAIPAREAPVDEPRVQPAVAPAFAAPVAESPAAAAPSPAAPLARSSDVAVVPAPVVVEAPAYVAPAAPAAPFVPQSAGFAPGLDAAALGTFAAMPEVRTTASLAAPAGELQTTINRFVERLVGVRTALETRVLPIEAAESVARIGELVRAAEDRAAAPVEGPRGEVHVSRSARADVAPAMASFVAPAHAPEVVRPRAAAAAQQSAAANVVAQRPSPAVEARSVAPRDEAIVAPAQAAAAAVTLRPGGIGVRTEQLAGTIGVRAAGVSIDFVDPARLPALVGGRASAAFAYLLPPSLRPAAGTVVFPQPATTGEAVEGEAAAVAAAAAPSLSFPVVTPSAPSPTATATPTARAAQAAGGAEASEAIVARRPAAAAPAPVALAAAEAEVARRIDAVWSLIRVFPASAPAALAAAAEGLASRPAQAMPLLTAMAAAERARQTATAAPSAQADAAPVAAPASPAARTAGAPAAASTASARPVVAEAPSARPLRTTGAPASYVAPVAASPRASVPALDRPVLPDGRMPRGSFLWTRAAEFTPTVGEWTPPQTVTAASAGAEAAATGQPAWGAMPPVVTPSVQEAFGEAPTSAGGGRGGTARTATGRTLVGLPGGNPVRATAAQAARSEAAEAASVLLGAPIDAPLLRLVSASAGGTPSGGTPNIPSWAEQMHLVQPAPVVPAAPASESTAKIVEALRSQQQQSGANDDRVTLADLTLVAVASSTGKLAASSAPASTGAHASQSPAAAGGKGGPSEKKSPEAERREIEELARHVLDEVERMCEIARERSGDPWEA